MRDAGQMYVYDVSVHKLYSADVAAAYDRLLASTVEGDSNFPDFVFATAFSRLHTLITPEPASATVFWVPIWLAGVCLVHNATNGGYTEGWSWAKHSKDLPFWCPALHPVAAWVTEQSWWQRHQGADHAWFWAHGFVRSSDKRMRTATEHGLHLTIEDRYSRPPLGLAAFNRTHPPRCNGRIAVPYYASPRIWTKAALGDSFADRPVVAAWAGSTQVKCHLPHGCALSPRAAREQLLERMQTANRSAAASGRFVAINFGSHTADMESSISGEGLAELYTTSRYCPVPPGDTRTSKRFFCAILSLCVPIVYDRALFAFLPFPSSVDWSELAVLDSGTAVWDEPEAVWRARVGRLAAARDRISYAGPEGAVLETARELLRCGLERQAHRASRLPGATPIATAAAATSLLPEVLLVLSDQRSATELLEASLADTSHGVAAATNRTGCVGSFGEVFSHIGAINKALAVLRQRELVGPLRWMNATAHLNRLCCMARHIHSLTLLRSLRQRWCELKCKSRAAAGTWCAIVVRVFPGHLPREDPRVNASLEELLAHPAVAPIIDERRDLREQECSQNYSKATQDFSAVPTEEHRHRRHAWAAKHCAAAASPDFVRRHDDWYGGLRASLRTRAFVDLDFEDVTRDTPGSVARVARRFAGRDS